MRSLILLLGLFPAVAWAADPPGYVAVGYGGRRMFSPDGRNWTVTAEWAENGGDDDNNLMGVAYGHGKFVVVGGAAKAGPILVSENGRDWREVMRAKSRVNPVLFTRGRFVAGGPDRRLLWSDDGETWTVGPQVAFREGPPWAFWFRRGAAGNGVYLFIGNAGHGQKIHWCCGSRHGTTIEHVRTDLPPVRDIAYGNGRFVLVGPDGLRWSTPDGLEWDDPVTEPGVELTRVVWTGREFVAGGRQQSYRSPDGRTWEPWPTKIPCSLLWADDDVFIGTNWPGKMMSSPDGQTWTAAPLMPPNGINQAVAGRDPRE